MRWRRLSRATHGAHLAHTGPFEFGRNGLEQGFAHAVQARFGFDRQGNDPAARGRPEFPGTDLADDEPKHAGILTAITQFGHQEKAVLAPAVVVAREDLLPIIVFDEAGHPLIKRDDGGDVG